MNEYQGEERRENPHDCVLKNGGTDSDLIRWKARIDAMMDYLDSLNPRERVFKTDNAIETLKETVKEMQATDKEILKNLDATNKAFNDLPANLAKQQKENNRHFLWLIGAVVSIIVGLGRLIG